MKKGFLLFALLTAGILVTSCLNRSQKPSGDISAIADSSRNALDWEGTYYGVLPCADCEGIETVITIRYDETYIIKTKYLGKDDQVFEEKGTFTWNELGNIITLDQPIGQKYLVGENQLFHLDQNGQRIIGELAEHYRLPMVPQGLFGKTWKLIELNGSEIAVDERQNKVPQLVFNDLEDSFSGNAGCNNIMGQYELEEENFKIKFSQVATTLMACPDMELEREFIKVLETVDNFSLLLDTLSLNRAKMAPVGRFVAVYFR